MKRWLWVFGALMLGAAGCVDLQTRGQSAEETERDKDLDIRTIGDVTEVFNVQPIQVHGVGLVTGLEGTGHSPPSMYRTMLEQQLRKQRVENVKELLDSPNNCLVTVTAFIPPGSRRGDAIDIEVWLPDRSKATSLRGGYLQECFLREYDTTKGLNPSHKGSDQLVSGHILASARGPLLVGFGSTDFGSADEAVHLKKARIWGGGISYIDRPLNLYMKNDDKSVRIAKGVSDRLNLLFQDDPRAQRLIQNNQRLFLLDDVARQLNDRQDPSLKNGEVAKAVDKSAISLRVPFAYRYNIERYLRVARLVPLHEDPAKHATYRRRLQKMLLDPSDTIRAALRLEALGRESMAALKKGLESEQPLVRFASAEALAYLGATSGVEELARLAEQHIEVRMYCLMALSSLDESICRTKLSEMLTSDDTSLRCGAFRALRLLLDEKELRRELGGEVLGQAFWLHRVAPKSSPLVYFALGKKAEVVLFGEDIRVAPVRLTAGSDYVVVVTPGDDRCTVSRITPQGATHKQCSLLLNDVLRALTELGAGYPEAVDLLRKLDDRQVINCPIAANILPPLISVEELSEAARQPGFLRDGGGLAGKLTDDGPHVVQAH
jgi:flagellar basal body P-ring protein FlgI